MIGAEARRLLRDAEVSGDPAGASAEEAPGTSPRKAKQPERKSTGPIEPAKNLKKGTIQSQLPDFLDSPFLPYLGSVYYSSKRSGCSAFFIPIQWLLAAYW